MASEAYREFADVEDWDPEDERESPNKEALAVHDAIFDYKLDKMTRGVERPSGRLKQLVAERHGLRRLG